MPLTRKEFSEQRHAFEKVGVLAERTRHHHSIQFIVDEIISRCSADFQDWTIQQEFADVDDAMLNAEHDLQSVERYAVRGEIRLAFQQRGQIDEGQYFRNHRRVKETPVLNHDGNRPAASERGMKDAVLSELRLDPSPGRHPALDSRPFFYKRKEVVDRHAAHA